MKRLIRQAGKREENLLKALIDGVTKQSNNLLVATGKVDGNGVILEITVADDGDIEEIEQFLDIDIKVDDGTTKLDMLIKNICKNYLPGAGLQQKSTNSSKKVVYHIA